MTSLIKRFLFPGFCRLFIIAGVLFPLPAAARAPVPDGFQTEYRQPAAGEREIILYGPVFTIDQKYRSMKGPYDTIPLSFTQPDTDGDIPPRLLWVTGYEAQMVSADGRDAMPAEFMCHSNLDLDWPQIAGTFGTVRHNSDRLATLSQGQLSMTLPDGFGIPLMSNNTLNLALQVLNLNHEGDPIKVRHRITLRYQYDDERAGPPMTPLFTSWAQGMVLLEGPDGYYGVESPDAEEHGPGCAIGKTADDSPYEDGLGRKFSGHWVVPPGRQEIHTLNTRIMNIPFPTTIHYIAVHLHPFAESIELVDLTTGESLFKSAARNYPDRIGLDHVDDFSSADGIPVDPDHEYDVVTVYNNTSGEDQDSMAVMYLYLRDRDFVRPDQPPQPDQDGRTEEDEAIEPAQPRQRGTVL